MKNNVATKNYLFGTKISFMMFSFILVTIAITVHHDIWPFLLENLPQAQTYHSWAPGSVLTGLIFPGIWLRYDWQYESTRYILIALILMYLLQVITEVVVCHYFFLSMTVPTAILYICYRIVQLINLQRLLYKNNYPRKTSVTIRSIVLLSSLGFWGFILFKLAFITFPQIIPELF